MTNKLYRMLARLPTYATYIKERPSWLLVLLGGRVLFARRLERWVQRAKIRPLAAQITTRLLADAPEKIISDLRRDGVSPRLRLSATDVIAIRLFADQTPCTTRAAPVQSFYPRDLESANAERPRDIIAAYYFDKVRESPTITAIEHDPLIRAVAESYIGATPLHIRTRLWWSFPGKRVSDADLHAAAQDKYHFDLNGFRTLKFFFYISDVDAGSGPHAYIAGSHRRRKLSHQYTLMVGHDEKELRSYYGDDSFFEITGNSGFGFAEDPFIFHVGKTCRQRERLVLEVEFGPTASSPSYKYGVLG